jgi:hypothetical protein
MLQYRVFQKGALQQSFEHLIASRDHTTNALQAHREFCKGNAATPAQSMCSAASDVLGAS